MNILLSLSQTAAQKGFVGSDETGIDGLKYVS